jgi:hypothetical protein
MARGGRRSTSFQPGNQAALKHGGRSEIAARRHSSEVRAEIAAIIAEHLPHKPQDGPLIDITADAISKLRLMQEHYDRSSDGSLLTGRGSVKAGAHLYVRLLSEIRMLFRELGIGPSARAEIEGKLGIRNGAVLALAAQQRLRERHARAVEAGPA